MCFSLEVIHSTSTLYKKAVLFQSLKNIILSVTLGQDSNMRPLFLSPSYICSV